LAFLLRAARPGLDFLFALLEGFIEIVDISSIRPIAESI
jgi:hypothetical protein